MPFAFVQYRTKHEADSALVGGRNHIIHGRQCRTETARAQRALYISRKDGKEPVEEEVRELLTKAGPIEKIFAPSETDMEKHRLPQGLWVRFAFWEDCRDALKAHRQNPTYHLDHEDDSGKAGVFSPKRLFDRHQGSPMSSPMHCDPNIHDPRALFVGQLPGSVSRTEVEDIFRVYGPLQSVTVNTRHNAGKLNSHAVVMFHSAVAAMNALSGEHGRLALVDGTPVRVEYALLRRPGFHGSPNRFNRHTGNTHRHHPSPQYHHGHQYMQQSPQGPLYGMQGQPFLRQQPLFANSAFQSPVANFPVPISFQNHSPGQGYPQNVSMIPQADWDGSPTFLRPGRDMNQDGGAIPMPGYGMPRANWEGHYMPNAAVASPTPRGSYQNPSTYTIHEEPVKGNSEV